MHSARRSVIAAGNSNQSGTGWGGGGVGIVTPFFSDSFAGGQLNPANGFTYTALGAFGSLSTDQAHSGTHSVKITYGPNAPDTYGNQGGNVELRFDMGRYVSELWVKYWLFLPSNYTHKRNSIASGLSSNNKFLLVWRNSNQYFGTAFGAGQEMDFDYSGNNPPDGSASRLYTTERLAAVPAAIKDFSNGVPGLGGTNGPVLKGQWNELKVHWKPSSAAGVLDGVYQWWVNGTLIHNFSGQDFWNHTSSSETDVKLRAGYFMGSCDSGFLAATSVFLDDLEFYDTNPGWV